MKGKLEILLLCIFIGAMIAFNVCSDDDCPSGTFNSLKDCEDATDGKKYVCVEEDADWKAILNP